MRTWIIVLFVTLVVRCFGAVTMAQTPSSAIRLYKHGTVKLNNGDVDGAIDDFTRAIELGSRLGPVKSASFSRSFNGGAATDESANLTVIDPFIAQIYSNRGAARFRKRDFAGALEDLDRAISIRPNLAQAYVNRAAARTALRDLSGAFSRCEPGFVVG